MQKVLIGIVITAIILTIPSIYNRIQVEEANKTVETVLSYNKVVNWLNDDPELERDQVLNQIAEAGVNSISIEPVTLNTLKNQGKLTVFGQTSMNELMIFNGVDPSQYNIDEAGIFVHSTSEKSFEELTNNWYKDTSVVTVAGVDYIFVPGRPANLQAVPLGYDNEAIEAILGAGMEVITRLSNTKDPEEMEAMAERLIELKQPGIEKILFSGTSLPFVLLPERLKSFSSDLEEAGYSIFLIEFNDQAGFDTAAYSMDLKVNRLLSRVLTTDTVAEIAEQYVRGAKERNIRAFFLNVAIPKYEEALPVLQELDTEIESQLPSSFDRGSAEVFDEISVPLWQLVIGLIGSIAFLGWAAESVFKKRKLTIAALAGLSLMTLAYLVTGIPLILKVLALAIAVTAPVLAVLLKKNTESKFYLFKAYFQAVAVSFIGVWLIVVLLNGNAFILGIDEFRGVKLVYILPIAFLILYAIWENLEQFLKSNVIYWHLIVIAVIGAVAMIYIGRSGNEGGEFVIPYELQFRTWLEQVLYVRPRTKEFLLGLPVFVLALHVAKTYKKASIYLMIIGVIGFLSIINTFTHFHIPLSISLLRTGYSVILGLLIGLVLIFLYKWAGRKLMEEIERRQQS